MTLRPVVRSTVLIGTRHLAIHGGPVEVVRAARRLLIFSSTVTLALNVAEPLIAGQYGKAAFDAVGPLLLIGWAEAGPDLLQGLQGLQGTTVDRDAAVPTADRPAGPVVEADVLASAPVHRAESGSGPVEVVRAARRLLIFSSTVTLALNIAEPLIAGHYGKGAFDAVGPLLLIGWAEVAPGLLHAMHVTASSRDVAGPRAGGPPAPGGRASTTRPRAGDYRYGPAVARGRAPGA
nr:hypothetical protein [Protofrankia sp. BMG5.30]